MILFQLLHGVGNETSQCFSLWPFFYAFCSILSAIFRMWVKEKEIRKKTPVQTGRAGKVLREHFITTISLYKQGHLSSALSYSTVYG